MSASMWNLCYCGSSMFAKTVNNARVYVPCNKNIRAILSWRACWNCARSCVVSTEQKTFVTSSCLPGRPSEAQALSDSRKENIRMAPWTFNSAHNTWPALSCSLHRFLFPHRHKPFMFRSLFHCRTLRSQNSQTQSQKKMQTESTKNAADSSPSGHVLSTNSKTDQRSVKGTAEDVKLHTSNGNQEKKENIKTIPNLLTTLRMASAPLLGYLVVCESYGLAFGLFTIAGITDLLDGYIARNVPNQTSALGSAIDPLADKLLMTVLTISMTSVGLIPLPLTALIVFRDVSLTVGGFYIRYRSLPPPITLSRYFDISYATVEVNPTFISKMNTALQLLLVAFSLAAPVFGFIDHMFLHVLWYSAGATTFLSGADYCLSWKKYVKLLEKDQKSL